MLNKLIYFLRNPGSWYRWINYYLLDIKYGKKYLGKPIANANHELGYVYTGSTDYHALDKIFKTINIKDSDVIVDVGCGKGRVFNWFLNKGYKNKLIGLEVDVNVAEFTRQRLAPYKQVEVITGAIEDRSSLPGDGTIFYLFHPFQGRLMQEFADQMTERLKNKDGNRPIIVYYNACYLNVFENNPLWKVTKLGILSVANLPAAIIEPAC